MATEIDWGAALDAEAAVGAPASQPTDWGADLDREQSMYERAARHIGVGQDRPGRVGGQTEFLQTYRDIPVKDRQSYLQALADVARQNPPANEFDPMEYLGRGLDQIGGMPQGVARAMGWTSPDETATLDFFNAADAIRRGAVPLKKELGSGVVATAGELAQEAVGGALGMAPGMAAGGAVGRIGGVASRLLGAGPTVAGRIAAGSSTAYWGAQELPELYDSARKLGVDEDSARAGALVAAPIVGAMELVQFGHVSDPLKNLARRRILESALQYSARAGKEFAKTTVANVAQEGGQQAVGTAMRATLAALDKEVLSGEGEWANFGKDELSQMGATLRRAALSIPLLQAPSAVAQFAGGLANPESVQERLEQLKALRTVKPQEIKREAEKIGITGSRTEIRQKAEAEIQQREQEIQDASAVSENKTVPEKPGEVGQGVPQDSGGNLRESGEDQVRPEPAGKGPAEQVAPPQPPQIGEYVQWVSQGTDQFTTPKRVRGISEDGQFVFVDGSDTGIPATEAHAAEAPVAPQQTPAAEPTVDKPQSAPAPTEASPPVSEWSQATRQKLEAVPAFKGSTIEVDEDGRTARVKRPDGRATTIHFDADAELARIAKRKGVKAESVHGAYVFKRGKKGALTEGDIYLRSDAEHRTVNHEVIHWLEDEGIITPEEVEKHGGRERIATEYAKWATQQKPNTLFQKIYDFLEPIFSSRRRFFEDVGERGTKPTQAQEAPKSEKAPEPAPTPEVQPDIDTAMTEAIQPVAKVGAKTAPRSFRDLTAEADSIRERSDALPFDEGDKLLDTAIVLEEEAMRVLHKEVRNAVQDALSGEAELSKRLFESGSVMGSKIDLLLNEHANISSEGASYAMFANYASGKLENRDASAKAWASDLLRNWLESQGLSEGVFGPSSAWKAPLKQAVKERFAQLGYDVHDAITATLLREMGDIAQPALPPVAKESPPSAPAVPATPEVPPKVGAKKPAQPPREKTKGTTPKPAPEEAKPEIQPEPQAVEPPKPQPAEKASIGQWEGVRSTSRGFTPELDRRADEAEKQYDAARTEYNKAFAAYENSNKKWGPTAEKRKAKAEKLKTTSDELFEVYDKARKEWYRSRLEDAAEQTENVPLAIAARRELASNAFDKSDRAATHNDRIAQDEAVEQLRSAVNDLVPAALEQENDFADVLTKEREQQAVDLAVGSVVGDVMSHPLQAENLVGRLAGRIRGERVALARQDAEREIDALEMGGDATTFRQQVQRAYDWKSMQEAVENAKLNKAKSDEGRRIAAENAKAEQKAQEKRERARQQSAQGDFSGMTMSAARTLPSRQAMTDDSDSVWTDGRIALLPEALPDAVRKKLAARPIETGTRKLNPAKVRELIEAKVKPADKAEFVAAFPAEGKEDIPVAVFVDAKNKTHRFDANMIGWLVNTKAVDSFAIDPSDRILVLKREGETVGIVMGLEGGAQVDVPAVRKVVESKQGKSKGKKPAPSERTKQELDEGEGIAKTAAPPERFAKDFDAAFAKIIAGDRTSSLGSGEATMASIQDLRRLLPQYSEAEFNAGVRKLREQDLYSADVAQGQLPLGVREAGIKEGSDNLVWISKRAPGEGEGIAPERRAGPGAAVPTSPFPSGGPTPSTGEVVSAISRSFGVPVRTGHFRGGQGIRGIYKTLEEVARIKGYGDIAVSAHEVAHHVDKTTGLLTGMPSSLKTELAALDYHPTRGDIHEGFAEYMRHRLTTDEAPVLAPGFHGWFNNWLTTHPAIADAVTTSRAVVDQWRGAGAVERVKAQIHMGESTWTKLGRSLHPKTVWDWIANNWIDRLRPLRNVAKEMTGTGSDADLMGRMPGDLNFWAFAKVSNLAAAAKARGWAHYGTADAAGNKVGPGLAETFAPIADELRKPDTLLEFYAYAYARHAITLYDQYDQALAAWHASGNVGPAPKLKEPGIGRTDAQFTVSTFDPKPGWRDAAEGLTSWHNDLIDYLADAGGISQEAVDAMKAMYPNYISLARHIDNELAPTAGGGGSRFANLPQAVRRLKGSGRQILPPLESALAYAERIIGLADKVRVSKMLIEASRKYNTLGDTVEKVDPKTVAKSTRLENLKQQLEDAGADLSSADTDALLTIFSQQFTGDAKDNILVIYENGKPQLYYVRPDLYRALMAVDKPARLPKVIDHTFGRTARAIRLGATGLKPGFSLLTNPLRDIATALNQSEYQPRNPFSIALNAAQGLVEEITGGEVSQMWERGGGPMAQPLGVDRRFLKEAVQEILARSPKAKALNWMRHPVDSMRSLFSLPESAPRLAEFRAALNKLGWKPGQQVTFEQYIKAQLAAANVTTDFTEGGTLAMWVNQVVPFFNATIQGPNRMASAIRSNPVARISNAVLWLTIPSLLLWWRQKDEEWYKNLTASEKARYWHVKIPGMDTPLRIPKPFEWGHIFASMPEGAAQSLYDKDPEAFGEAAGQLLNDLTPDVLPGLVKSPVEVAANKEFYFDRPLVREKLEGLEPKDQYAPYTTETAKGIGALLGVSPIYVEHLASGWTGGLATDAAAAMESVAGVGRKKTQRNLVGGASTLPVVGRLFMSPLHTRQFDDFYERMETLEQKHASLALRNKSDPSITMLKFMQHRAKDMAELRGQTREILADDTIPDEQKRDQFVQLHQQMLQMATEANQMAHLNRPSTDAAMQKQWQKIHREESANVVYDSLDVSPKPDKYTGRESDYRQAQKEYLKAQEINKQRIFAVSGSLDEARQLLLEHYRPRDKKTGERQRHKTGEVKSEHIAGSLDYDPTYVTRLQALNEIYGK